METNDEREIDYRTSPAEYRHIRLSVDGEQATIALAIDENAGLRPGYRLKLNSYDLGVDIELYDALQRIRFEHPAVKVVVLTSLKERVFCSGANIFMLGLSSHAWKVNFCKFTNETRNGMEDSSHFDGLKFLAAVNGACAGGGYELALACDEILLVDDRSSAVSLPEVPLLAVLPGTGGLTRVTDKRKVRHDLADVFCTSVEGVRGQRALDWGLVDALAKPAQFAQRVTERVSALASQSQREGPAHGISLTPLERTIAGDTISYPHLEIVLNRDLRYAEITFIAPQAEIETTEQAIIAAGVDWYPLALARAMDDAILYLRTNEASLGTWLLKTRGDAKAVLQADEALLNLRNHWLGREVLGLWRRSLARLDVSSRSLIALLEEGSCFAGSFAELALAADRSYMLIGDKAGAVANPSLCLNRMNFGPLPMVTSMSRLARRFYGDEAKLASLQTVMGQALSAEQAAELGLITFAVDELDWADEIRLMLEERAALSPDALSGLEANLRFGGSETMLSRIFGRLSAWQNWIFQRPNAVGTYGSLKTYGSGEKAQFDRHRV